MSSSALIGVWASGLWGFIGSPVNVSALTISGFATIPSTLGSLNSYISTCYSGSGYSGPGTVNYDVVPDIGQEELALIAGIYMVGYYNSLSSSTMGYGGDSIPYIMVGEGDTKIMRTNAAAIGTAYAKMAQQAQQQMQYLINNYVANSQGGNTPRDVSYLNVIYTNGWGGWGGGGV